MPVLTLGRAMKRRSGAGGKLQGRKRSTPKRRNAPKTLRNRGASIAGQGTIVARLTHERDEALLRETANSEILRLISKSPDDLELVFRTILENATRICNANFGTLFRFDSEKVYPVAQFNTPTGLLKAQTRRGPFQPTPGTAMEHVVRTKQVSHSADRAAEPVPGFFAEHGGARSQVVVPMLKDDALIGAIAIYRQEVRPFTDKQSELVKNFAAQAVIAIENARLFNELRQRTTDLSASLEQQTATSEVLRVISSSQGELQPVFEAMLANAVRLCEAKFGVLYRYEGHLFHPEALVGAPQPLVEFHQRRGAFETVPGTPLHRLWQTREVVHTADDAGSPSSSARFGGARSHLAVPMFKGDALVGSIIIYRQEVRPFTDKQIDLVKNFAAQAVIAIENARLLNELRQRTNDLSEALEQQTATSEVLRVISSSPGELKPVFDAMLQNATRICEAKFGTLYLREGEGFRTVAAHNAPPAYIEARTRELIRPAPDTALGGAAATKGVVHIADIKTIPSYVERNPFIVTPVELGGYRTVLAVPMLKNNELIGVITVNRQEVRPFTDKQIALMQNFAAQAVIAIENARLLKELRERTDQLEIQSEELAKLNRQLEGRVADQVGEIERMSRLRRFLPPQVADLIVASGSEKQLESHRREITALFCDLRGFTGFSESSDPEDVIALLRDYHAAIGQIIVKYSGTLERFAGDGVMVIFNDPVPVENPALQAVLMALDMRSAIGAMIEKWRDLGHDLGFGIGIAHGFATLGTIGFEGRFDYAAIGTVSNVASRLCDEAKPGQILVSPRVRSAVDKAVMVEPVGEFTLKGIRRPLMTYNVLVASPSKPN
jgi:GAF domain-containing protein